MQILAQKSGFVDRIIGIWYHKYRNIEKNVPRLVGNLLTATDSNLAKYNPLRYRGYVYDQETGLYYLQSRYYNPEWGRFINADGLLSSDHLVGLNLYAYCYNNPVNLTDETGKFAISAFLIASIIGGAIAGCVISTVSYLSTNEEATVAGAIDAAIIGTITGGLGGAAGALGGGYAVGLSLLAGLCSGTYTAVKTEGPIEQKLAAGASSFMFTAAGSYFGSMIPLDKMGFGLTVAGNTIFGMTIGGYLEGANVWVQERIADTFEKPEPFATNPFSPCTGQNLIPICP